MLLCTGRLNENFTTRNRLNILLNPHLVDYFSDWDLSWRGDENYWENEIRFGGISKPEDQGEGYCDVFEALSG